jgi:hypothetical protein
MLDPISLNIENVSDAAFAAVLPAPPTTLLIESAASAALERGGNFTGWTPGLGKESELNKEAQSIVDMKQLLKSPAYDIVLLEKIQRVEKNFLTLVGR